MLYEAGMRFTSAELTVTVTGSAIGAVTEVSGWSQAASRLANTIPQPCPKKTPAFIVQIIIINPGQGSKGW